MPNLTARQLLSGSPEVGRICPYCSGAMATGELIVTCPDDGTIHHVACWRENHNHCSTFGCAGRGVVVATATVAASIEWVDPPPQPFPPAPGPVIDINIPVAPPAAVPAPPPTTPPAPRPPLNLRAAALWAVAGLVIILALFQFFGGDDPLPTPLPTALPVAGLTATAEAATRVVLNATATAAVLSQATARSDADGDGLSLEAEAQYGTDADNADSDHDGLEDGQEIGSYYDTDPLDADSDNDGLDDEQEIRTLRTKPIDADTDDDGLADGVEVARGLDPRVWDAPTEEPAPPTRQPTRIRPTATPPSPVTGLRLINTNSDRAIGPLRDGDTISLARVGSALSIEALVSGSGVGSVVFYLDDDLFCMNNADRCFENAAPYAMSGDQGGDYYNNWDWSRLARGRHTVTVVTCSAPGGTGGCAVAMTVSFTIAR